MKQVTLLLLLAASARAVLRRFDDADFSLLTYNGVWVHEDLDRAALYDGTQSYSNSPTATFSFSFTGTGFSLCAGLKVDRGPFSVAVDGVVAGTGTQYSTATDDAPACETVFSVSNLANTLHNVVVSNTGIATAGSTTTTYLTLDSVTLDLDAAAAAALTSSVSSSAATSSSSSVSSTSSSSSTIDPASSSSAAAASRSSASAASRSSASAARSASSAARASSSSGATASLASATAGTSSSSSGGASTGAIAGGVVGGIAALAIIAALAWFCCIKRRKPSEGSESGHYNPFISDHDTEENGDYANKNLMSQVSSPASMPYTSSAPTSSNLQQGAFHTIPEESVPAAIVAPIPYPAHRRSSSGHNRSYSNQFFPAQPGYPQTYTPSRNTSYMSAISSPTPAPPPSQRSSAVPDRLSVPVERDTPSPQPLPLFPTDVDESFQQEDAYGGMADEGEAIGSNSHNRRPSEIDFIPTSQQKPVAGPRRKPVPQA